MDFLTILSAVTALLVATLLALYIFSPRTLFNWLPKSLRRKGGLVEKSISAGGFNWPYLEGGPVDGDVVVLVHGFGGDKDNWAMFSPQITRKYRFISMDLPGFGENDRSLDREYNIASQVARLRQFLDAMGISKCHLGGNSMGGHISLQFALSHPEYVQSLTLYNNAGVMGTEESELQGAVENSENALGSGPVR